MSVYFPCLQIASKLSLPSLVHLKTIFFLGIEVRGFTKVSRFGMNLLTKLIVPKKLYNPFLWLGSGMAKIDFTLAGSMTKPSFETMYPRSFPWSVAKKHLFGFREIPYSQHFWNTCSMWLKWSFACFENTVISSN